MLTNAYVGNNVWNKIPKYQPYYPVKVIQSGKINLQYKENRKKENLKTAPNYIATLRQVPEM